MANEERAAIVEYRLRGVRDKGLTVRLRLTKVWAIRERLRRVSRGGALAGSHPKSDYLAHVVQQPDALTRDAFEILILTKKCHPLCGGRRFGECL